MATFDSCSKIAFIGAGVVGTTLAVSLTRAGYPVVAAASRTKASAEALAGRIPGCRSYIYLQNAVAVADVVFLTTLDDAIGSVASSLTWRPGQVAIHCSAVQGLDILDHAREQGAITAAFHPLQTFPLVERAMESLSGATFAIEADPSTEVYLTEMAQVLGGNPITLGPGDRALYHISAIMACGFVITLLKQATDLWQRFGSSRQQAVDGLLPLLRTTVESVATVGVPQALTGPYPRGDIGTISKHLATLESQVPEMLPLYCHMAQALLPMALEKGPLEQGSAEEIRELLEEYMSRMPATNNAKS